jgi:hypothetical protein
VVSLLGPKGNALLMASHNSVAIRDERARYLNGRCALGAQPHMDAAHVDFGLAAARLGPCWGQFIDKRLCYQVIRNL